MTWDPYLSPSTQHGVTTVLFGNCGVGFAPCKPHDRKRLIDILVSVEDIPGTALHEGIKWNWESFPEYLKALSGLSTACDFMTMIGHVPLRVYVMGERSNVRVGRLLYWGGCFSSSPMSKKREGRRMYIYMEHEWMIHMICVPLLALFSSHCRIPMTESMELPHQSLPPFSRSLVRALSLYRARRKDATTFALTCASNLIDASRFEGGTDKGRHQTDTSLRSRSSPVRCCRLFHITHVDAQRSGGRSHLRLVRREGRADSDLCRTS